MNEIPSPASASPARRFALHVIGVGGVGGKVAARLAEHWPHGRITVVDSDLAALPQVAGVQTHQLGTNLLRGLGAGGDPEHAVNVAAEEREALKQLCSGADVTLIVAGLGRGIGSGVAPYLAEIARENGSLVLGFAVQPFPMEGRRCCEQAEAALTEFKRCADGVVCLPNARMAAVVGAQASLVATFDASNRQLCDGLHAIARLLRRGGLMDADFAQFAAVLRGQHAESVFATVEVSGDARATAAVNQLLAHPFLESGAALDHAAAVLVGITGGPELGLGEVSEIMEQVNTRTGTAPVVLGASVDAALAGKLSVTLIVARSAEVETAPPPPRFPTAAKASAPAAPKAPEPPALADTTAHPDLGLGGEVIPKPATPRTPRSRPAAPAADSAPAKPAAGSRRPRATAAKLKQEQLPFDTVSKGRFDKSEPTIYQGEDLDLPTFVRRGVVLN
jgi:cell division protein FtsZ